MRSTPRTAGCFLVGEKAKPTTTTLLGSATVLTWEAMRLLLLQAVETQRDYLGKADLVASWVDRAFARYGISDAQAPAPQGGTDNDYGVAMSYSAIDALDIPPRVKRFLKGSEAVEAFYLGQKTCPPMTWLHDVPSRSDLSAQRYQQTSDRQINRWTPTWHPTFERSVP